CLGAWCLRVWRLAAVVPAEPQPGQAARLSGGVAGRCRGRREGPGLRPGRGRAGFWVGGGLRVRGGTGRRAVPRLIRLVARGNGRPGAQVLRRLLATPVLTFMHPYHLCPARQPTFRFRRLLTVVFLVTLAG